MVGCLVKPSYKWGANLVLPKLNGPGFVDLPFLMTGWGNGLGCERTKEGEGVLLLTYKMNLQIKRKEIENIACKVKKDSSI